MDLGLTGKGALVVGASRGIGRAIAEAFAHEGSSVGLVSRDPATLEAVAAAIASGGGRCLAHPADVRDPAVWDAVRQRMETELAPVSILVWAAAAPDRPARVPSITPAHWEEVLATDLSGMWRCAAALLPGMAQRGWGRILAIGSLMGTQGGFSEGAYAAAKGGLVGLVRTIAQEYAARGVTANVVVPGRIHTERTAGVSERVAEAMRKAIPMKREGEPAEVAAVAVFLASERASYVTGAEIPVTGGRELGMLSL